MDQVEWIEETAEGLSCIISVGGKVYLSEIPYKQIIDLLRKTEAGHYNFHYAG